MSRRLLLLSVVAVLASPVRSSDPGQPLDCSDWVFLEPGYSCLQRTNCGGNWESLDDMCYVGNDIVHVDVASGVIGQVVHPTGVTCGSAALQRVEVFRKTDSRSVIGYLDERCVDPANGVLDGFGSPAQSLFDASKGQLLFPSYSQSRGSDVGPLYPLAYLQYVIRGFATTFEVLQTFTPEPALGFRVPYMPEGLPAADHFDTYWGNLAHPIDFMQAQPLQCDYPSAPPQVGDYLTVSDTLPDPAPGTGRYYVTAATHQGATRYGRKRSNGQTSGRDPALLPGCTP